MSLAPARRSLSATYKPGAGGDRERFWLVKSHAFGSLERATE